MRGEDHKQSRVPLFPIHIDDSVLDPSGRVDPRKLKTIARLGGDFYCRSTDLFEMERP